MNNQTIVALSTPIGKGAIAVIRMSGKDAITIAEKIFAPLPKKSNYLKVGSLTTRHFTENAMCVYFCAPKSYTGEDMVEFHCHGGIAVASAVVDTCIENGARLAENGEFSKRAFINGKQNLSNAEGIIEMIEAETHTAVKAGENLLSNKLGKRTVELQDLLTDFISQTEVALDYPEEDLELQTKEQLKKNVVKLKQDIDLLLTTVQIGKIVKYGIDIVIIGKPNVGKSSLLNALIGTDRAIVTNTPGTTRDTLTESIVYKGVKFNFIDTAGIRHTDNEIEKEGIKRAEKAVVDADLVLYIVDDINDDSSFEVENKNTKVLKVYNKCDLYDTKLVVGDTKLVISALNEQNIDVLKEKIYCLYNTNEINQSNIILTNSRHIDCLTNTSKILGECIEEIDNVTLDLVSLKLRDAWQILGEITGTTATEEIINRIYSKFCLGK